MPKVSPAQLEERRLQLLKACLKCLGRRGFHQTTMRDLCQEIGVSPGGLYRYFPSKEAIIQAMVETDRAQLEMVFASLPPETSFTEVMEALFELVTDEERGITSREQIGVNCQITAEATTNEAMRTMLRRHYDLMTDRLELVVRRSLERGEIRSSMSPRTLAVFLIALFDGMFSRCAVDDRLDLTVMAREFLDQVRHLLGADEQQVGPTMVAADSKKGSRKLARKLKEGAT